MAAAAASRPGWSGTSITDPVAFLESILIPIITTKVTNAADSPIYTEIKDVMSNNGKSVVFAKNDYHDILTQSIDTNIKDYQIVSSLGLTRLAADANGNCFFDSFLTLMSPTYRSLSIQQRRPVMSEFRKWCVDHSSQILRSIPSKILSEKASGYKDPVEADLGKRFKAELERKNTVTEKRKEKNASGKNVIVSEQVTIDKEIDFEAGYILGWYFGINLVFLATPGTHDMFPGSTGYEPYCNTAYQSSSCRTAFIAFTGNHFEPLVDAKFTEDGELDETNSTFLFRWSNPLLCKVKSVANHCATNELYRDTYRPWTEPACAAAGGRRRKGRRSTRKSIRRRKATRKARK